MSKKRRIQLNFSEKAFEKLEEIMDQVGATRNTTKGEVITEALKLYGTMVDEYQKNPNGNVMFYGNNDRGSTRVIFESGPMTDYIQRLRDQQE